MTGFRGVLHVLGAIALAACSLEAEPMPTQTVRPPVLDAGTPDGGRPVLASGSTRLLLLSDTRVRLDFGQSIEIEVQLQDRRGEPLRRARVGFDLVGQPEDAALSTLDATTDSDGIARTQLIAGQRSASFQLRASAVGALDLNVEAAVSAVGFGNILVQAPYAGARTVAQRSVLAFAGASCSEVTPTLSDPAIAIPSALDSARLIALPAGTTYAVVALGRGPGGVVLAQGCVDGVLVRADAEQKMLVALSDLPLALPPAVALELQLSANAPATALTSTLRRAIETEVRLDPRVGQLVLANAEGRFWLDSLDASLRESTGSAAAAHVALADALVAARQNDGMGSTPDADLSNLLAINGEGMELAAKAMGDALRPGLEALTLRGTLTFDERQTLDASWASHASLASALVEDGPQPELDLSALAASPADVVLAPGDDALELTRLLARAQLGLLTDAALHAAMLPDGEGYGDMLMEASGCPSLAEWLAEQTYVDASACDEACVAAACDRAMARAHDAAETALTELDGSRPWLELAGTLTLLDVDGDGIAEQLQSEALAGEWKDQVEGAAGDAVTATATGTASVP